MYYDTGGAFDVERLHDLLHGRQLTHKVNENPQKYQEKTIFRRLEKHEIEENE